MLLVLHVPSIILTQFLVLNFDGWFGVLPNKYYFLISHYYINILIFYHYLWGRVVDQEISEVQCAVVLFAKLQAVTLNWLQWNWTLLERFTWEFDKKHLCESQLFTVFLKKKNPHKGFHKSATYWKSTCLLTIDA